MDVRIEYDSRPKIVQRWMLVTTSGRGITHRRRYVSRLAAVRDGAAYLAFRDERRIAAEAVYDAVRHALTAEHMATLDALTPQGDDQ